MTQTVFCRNCGDDFGTKFKPTEFYGEVCGIDCSKKLSSKREMERVLEQPYLSVAELEYIPALDNPLNQLSNNSDIVIDRWTVPSHLEFYFRGPKPEGWPAGVALEFPIATLRDGVREERVFGLTAVLLFVEKLVHPHFQTTKVYKRTASAKMAK